MGGALWLLGVCAAFETWALISIHTPFATVALVAMLLTVAVLIAIGIWNARAVLRLPGGVPPRTENDRRKGRQYGWIVVLEVVAFVVANTVLGATNRVIMIPAVDLMSVGVHFVPLASLFGVRRYYVMAALFCAIPALTLLAVPESVQIGQAQMWWVVPTLGCGVVGIATAAGSLREVRRSLANPLEWTQ
jgi:hypothetical protein